MGLSEKQGQRDVGHISEGVLTTEGNHSLILNCLYFGLIIEPKSQLGTTLECSGNYRKIIRKDLRLTSLQSGHVLQWISTIMVSSGVILLGVRFRQKLEEFNFMFCTIHWQPSHMINTTPMLMERA